MVMKHFVYPPTYLCLTYPLGLMPYVPAFSGWTVDFGGPFGIPRVLQFLVRRATAIVLRPQVLNGSALWSET
jgi:hypothetical protein